MMKIFNHISTILKHKWFVYVYCKEMGITWRGVKHDLSKFHPTEFLESLKYYKKGSSPIPRCKKDKGYSNAWFHHRGHNDHHYEYWVDNLDNGGVSVKMPYDAMLEMIADWLAAGRAYNGKSFTYKQEYDWLQNFLKTNPKIHPVTLSFVKHFIKWFAVGFASPKDLGRCYYHIKKLYEECEECEENDIKDVILCNI